MLCLNRRQVAFGAAGPTLTRAVLEATYGGAIVDLPPAPAPGAACCRPTTTTTTEAALATVWSALADPWSDGTVVRALAEVGLIGVVGGVLGCWIVLYGLSYGAESLAHALFPGLVAAALLGLPLLRRRRRRASRSRRSRSRLAGRRRRSAATRRSRSW